MRAMRIAMGGLLLSTLGCGPASEAPLPKLTSEQQAAANGVAITRLSISERALEARAEDGAAAVELRLAPGEPMPLFDRLFLVAMGEWAPERDGARPCQLRIYDRDGELLRQDGATVGITETRSLEDFEADLKVAEGLAALLSKNQEAWNAYRWELRDVGRTAHQLQGLRGPKP